MKISIKTDFWNQDKDSQIEKLVNIQFWGAIFFMINLITFSALYENIFMTIVNGLILTLYLLIQVSFNKREKNGRN